MDQHTSSGTTGHWNRRQFIQGMTATAFVSAFSLAPLTGMAGSHTVSSLTIQEVIDLILKRIPGAPFRETVDTVKSGDPQQPVTGIVTTMFATVPVIEKAAAKGANFIIAHEPTFYNHFDDTKWLEDDPVYRYKAELLEKHKIVVWRCHDYIHAHKPDGVMTGVLQAMGWENYVDPKKRFTINIPPASVESIIALAKNKLGIRHLRYIGNKKSICRRILLIPGAAGGRTQITALKNEKPDLLIVGELQEWETSEYVRDLRASGGTTSLLVLGHIPSEEPGLRWLEKWLQPQVPGITVTHLPSQQALEWA